MGEEGYAEVQERHVDSFLRTLSTLVRQGRTFYKSQRPAYFGTFTKESAIITARTPFGQDHTLINYDFESDEEWDSDAEGEDIADSDGEEENEGNELEFDDFFRRDDDFGSDADSDGEEMAIVATRARRGERCIGVRFMRSKQMLRVPLPVPASVPDADSGAAEGEAVSRTAPTSVLKAAQGSIPPALAHTSMHEAPMRIDCARGGALVECDRNEKDVARLTSYRAVVSRSATEYALSWVECSRPDQALGREVSLVRTKPAKRRAKRRPRPTSDEVGTKKVPKAPQEPKVPPKPKRLDESLVPALIKHIYGKKDGTDKLVKEFLEAHKEQEEVLSKSNVERRMKEIAQKRKAEEGHGTARWIVGREHIEKAGLTYGRHMDAANPAVDSTPSESGEELKHDPVFDLAPVVFTPPRAPKRVRPVKIAEERGPAKSARLRGDTGALVKGMGDDWWPSPPASPDKGATPSLKEPALPSNEDGEAQFPMDVHNERQDDPVEPVPEAQVEVPDKSAFNQESK